MNRIWLGAGVAAALLIALVVALTTGGDTTPTSTTVALATTTTAAPTTTTTTTTSTTTTVPPTTTTTTEVPTTTTTLSSEEREAEVLELVTDLELQFFSAIYNSDLAVIEDLIGGQQLYEALVKATEAPDAIFSNEPTAETYSVTLYAIELDRSDCLVVAIAEDASRFRVDAAAEDLILVLWPVEESLNGWRIVKRFGGGTPESSWRPECDLQNREWRP